MWDWIMDLLRDRDVQKYLKFGIIPLAVVILIVCIAVADRPSKGEGETVATEPVTESTDTGLTPTLDAKTETLLSAPLTMDGVEEINTLMERYFLARISCDTQTLAQLFDSSAGWEEETVLNRLVKQTESVESYQNISCYTKNGLEEGSYVVFVRFDIKFYKTSTLAPSMLRCYVRQGEDGTYKIVESPDETISSYISQVEKTDEVIELAKSVNQALETAVAEDGKLASIYNSLRTEIQ